MPKELEWFPEITTKEHDRMPKHPEDMETEATSGARAQQSI